MKKYLIIFITLFVVTSGTLFSQSESGLIGRARGAAHECLKPYLGPNWVITPYVGVVSICFVSGNITEVSFSARPEYLGCGGLPCHPPPLPIIIATVQFGCDGELISASCY